MPLTARERALFGPRTEKEPGTVAWCWQTILLMQSRWKQKTIDEAGFNALVDELRAHEAWNVVPPEQPYGSLNTLLQAEIGCTLTEARERFVTQSCPKEGRPKKLCNLPSLIQRERAKENGVGIRTQRKLDYLAGHDEDLLREVQIGTMSIHAAYKRAKGKVPEAPFEVLLRAWCRASTEDQVRFIRERLSAPEQPEVAAALRAIQARLP